MHFQFGREDYFSIRLEREDHLLCGFVIRSTLVFLSIRWHSLHWANLVCWQRWAKQRLWAHLLEAEKCNKGVKIRILERSFLIILSKCYVTSTITHCIIIFFTNVFDHLTWSLFNKLVSDVKQSGNGKPLKVYFESLVNVFSHSLKP